MSITVQPITRPSVLTLPLEPTRVGRHRNIALVVGTIVVGAWLLERSAAREAAASFDLALDTLQHLPESRARAEQAIDLHLDASGALLAAAGPARSIDHAREAEVLAAAIGDTRRQGQALTSLAVRVWGMGDSERAIELNQRALALNPDDAMLQAGVNRALGFVWQTTGEYRSARECLRRAQEKLQRGRAYDWAPGAEWASLCPCLARLIMQGNRVSD